MGIIRILKSVKDKNNLLSFNQWTCGETLNNVTGITRLSADGQIAISNENSSLGNSSLKVIREDYNSSYYGISMSIPITEGDWGKQVTLAADVYNPSSSNVSIQYYEVGTTNRSSSSIPINTEFVRKTFEVSSTIAEDVTGIELRIVMQNTDSTEKILFIDNASIIIQ